MTNTRKKRKNLLKLPNQIFKIPAYVDLGRKFALAQHSTIFTYPKALIAPILAVLLSLLVLTRTLSIPEICCAAIPQAGTRTRNHQGDSQDKKDFFAQIKTRHIYKDALD